MVRFILNNSTVSTNVPEGTTLLDFIRYEKNLVGTKIGCREGDCGACTILIGELSDEGTMKYKSVTSCITPLGNVNGKHVVSIEGLNMQDLSPVQKAMVDEAGTQCGFCTVGFVVSFSGLCLSDAPVSYDDVISGIDGNICRCTGYKSIERAAEKIHSNLKNKDLNNPVKWLVDNKYIPDYFDSVPQRIKHLEQTSLPDGQVYVGGGTDLYVQKHDEMEEATIHFVSGKKELSGIVVNGNRCQIGAACTASNLLDSEVLKAAFPNLRKHLKLVSSTPIRNIGTLAGNFVNASPIGDLTAFFIALNSTIVLKSSTGKERSVLLRDFYKGYKSLDKEKDEHVVRVEFDIPGKNTFFNFEKVSKRTYLDIASVNTALSVTLQDDIITTVYASAGGVGPIPLFLKATCEYLTGKKLTVENIHRALEIIQTEISPISDARGTEEYKRLLLRQLFYAHFVELFPQTFNQLVSA